MAIINNTPIMTSNTTPSPYVVSASSKNGDIAHPWYAFDDNASTVWSPGTNNLTDEYIQLSNTVDGIKASQITLDFATYATYLSDISIQVSDDGVEWKEIFAKVTNYTTTSYTEKIELGKIYIHNYFRIYPNMSTTSYGKIRLASVKFEYDDSLIERNLVISKILKSNLDSEMSKSDFKDRILFTEDGDIYVSDNSNGYIKAGGSGVNTDSFATKDELNEVKQSVSDGKQLIATAIIDKGIHASSDNTFLELSEKISEIESGFSGDVYLPFGEVISAKYINNFKKGEIAYLQSNFIDDNIIKDSLVFDAETQNKILRGCIFSHDEKIMAIAHGNLQIYFYRLIDDRYIYFDKFFINTTVSSYYFSKMVMGDTFFNGDSYLMAFSANKGGNVVNVITINKDTFEIKKLFGGSVGASTSNTIYSILLDRVHNHVLVTSNAGTANRVKLIAYNKETGLYELKTNTLTNGIAFQASFITKDNKFVGFTTSSPYYKVYSISSVDDVGDGDFLTLEEPQSVLFDIHPPSSVNSVSMSDDCKYLVMNLSSSPYFFVYKFSEEANMYIKLPNPEDIIVNARGMVQISHDGKFIVIGASVASNSTAIYRINSGDEVVLMKNSQFPENYQNSHIYAITISPKDNYLIIGGTDGSFLLSLNTDGVEYSVSNNKYVNEGLVYITKTNSVNTTNLVKVVNP